MIVTPVAKWPMRRRSSFGSSMIGRGIVRAGGLSTRDWAGCDRRRALQALHPGSPDEYARHLAEPSRHRFLHVRDAVALADRLHLRPDAPIGEHRHVGKEMVLDLVVEPQVGVVGEIPAGTIVRR